MLKLIDDIDLKELEQYGFRFIYNKYTGEIEEIYKDYRNYGKKGLHFKKYKQQEKQKRKIFSIHPDKYIKDLWVIDGDILWINNNFKSHDFDFDTLYDLIKDDVVEQMDEEIILEKLGYPKKIS